MLDLAILGLLKDQPLHGYELRKRLSDSLGPMWGISYGSLYPALRRLEREGAIESAEPTSPSAIPIPATGSLDGDLATARVRRVAKPSRRTRKAYRITAAGEARLDALMLADDAPDDERTFTLKLVFCRHLAPPARVELLERRRATLAERLSRARRPGATRGDRYARSVVEHRTQSTQRDLEWVEQLLAAERGEGRTQGATA